MKNVKIVAVERISVRPDVCHGKPCVSGTRVMVYQVLDLLEAGRAPQEIVRDYYPDLTLPDISACIRFAKELVQNEDIHLAGERATG